MPRRLAACEPCRLSKLACDHLRPSCSRCSQAGQESDCSYRERPFKRTKTRIVSHVRPQGSFSSSPTDASPETPRTVSRKYPNPGYLGTSSYVSIFGHLPAVADESPGSLGDVEGSPHDQTVPSIDERLISQGARLLEQVSTTEEISRCSDLVRHWGLRGVHLALAGALTPTCIEASDGFLMSLLQGSQDFVRITKNIFRASSCPLNITRSSSMQEFCANLSQNCIRWEVLGLYFTAACRAATDVPDFSPLYTSREKKRAFQKTTMHFSNRCLELSLSLDCLNDLQLLLQYETFITYSCIEGDQSYRSWRQLGDVISSLYALGYHEQTGDDTTPVFLRDLRRAAFARAYSADKNLSIFLGRPPRIHSEYCRIKLPGQIVETTGDGNPCALRQKVQWPDQGKFDLIADTQWAAICAFSKELISDLRREQSQEERSRKASNIQAGIEVQWRTLPYYLRIEDSLKLNDQQAIERDFAVSARINYLHVLFLLRLAVVGRVAVPDTQLLHTSAAILSLIVEAIVLQDHLVSYYGLPAAGVICIALLDRFITGEDRGLNFSKIFRDLSVLVAQVEAGALLDNDHPNYRLMFEAVRAIKSLLDQTISGALAARATSQPQDDTLNQPLVSENDHSWAPWTGQEMYDFELDFWLNLAEHPTLAGTQSVGE